MRIVRYQGKAGEVRYGIHEGDRIAVADGDPFTGAGLRRTGTSVAPRDVKLLAPVTPPNILAIGKNYKAHAEEGGGELPKAPLLFMKATTAVTAPEDPIVIPRVAPEEVDYEAELGVVIGKTARNVKEEDALRYVLGYTCVNDVSARDCQRNDGQWVRGKSFDTFAPMGPWIETELDPGNLAIRCRVNGTTLQDSSTSLLVFGVPYLIAYFSAGMTLLPGTVISTGTPAGVGFARKPPVWLRAGDVVEVEIDGIGVLRNPVKAG